MNPQQLGLELRDLLVALSGNLQLGVQLPSKLDDELILQEHILPKVTICPRGIIDILSLRFDIRAERTYHRAQL